VVPYDALFGGDDATLKSLLDWLDLRHAPEILDHYRAQVAPEAQSIAQKLSLLPQEQQDELARAADWQTYRQLIALAPQPTAPSAAVRAKKKERRRAKRRETTDGRTEDAVS
jgi:hypothetical protein